MSEWRDPAIKLFGRKIPLQEEHTPMGEGDVAASVLAMEPQSKEEKGQRGSSNLNNSSKVSKQTSTDTNEAAISGQDKLLLKKPDKVLPYPRCNSMDTKFCYYNNYNVNQPRHFCKNRQRYWTAGGSMRNVPVGAGRRKNKHGGSIHRHISITPDALALARADGPDSIDWRSFSPFNGNATLLKFGPDAPLCESMASILSLGDQNLNSQLDFATAGAENREETSCSSACKPEENSMNSYSNGIAPFPHPQYFPGPLWGYPWNPGQEIPWTQPPFFASGFCSPYPFSFPFLPPFWSWTGSGRPWNLPWLGNSELASPSSSASTGFCSGNASPTLGKHSREEKTEKSLWVPKTLRIDDPREAAKSSIFATLGIIKPDEAGKFKAFSSSMAGTGKEGASILHTNPAAMSRSQSFQEIIS